MKSRILLIALGTVLPVSAFADSCIMKQHVEAQSSDGRYRPARPARLGRRLERSHRG